MRLLVRGDRDTVRALLEEFFTGQGWRVHADGPAHLDVETGSLRRALLLGALAGRRFHLRARLELEEVPEGTRVHHRWGATAGGALGGRLGAARAGRHHAAVADALAAHLREHGILREAVPER